MARRGRWTDDEGVEWTRRGEQVDLKRVERLLADPQTRVMRFGSAEVVDVQPVERAGYWARVRPYLRGVRRTPGEKSTDHLDCQVAEFRDLDRRVCLIFTEHC